MSSEESPNRRPAIQTQLGRKRQRRHGTLERFCATPRIGPPRSDIRPPAARQPKGPYPSVPETVVDPRPPVPEKPLTASALALLELYYRLNTFLTAIEEKAPIEWVAKRILGVRKRRAYAILREIDEHADLEAWFRQKVLVSMGRGRIGRGRQTQRSQLADAFFIALAGGVSEARSCARCLAGTSRADLQAAARDDPDEDEAAAEVRDYLVHSRYLWRLDADGG
jgi:hypothetical protein